MKNNKLEESLIKVLTESRTYYNVLATNRGMWGGSRTPMKAQGKYIVFKTRDVAEQYLKQIEDSQGIVNNFNSYAIGQVDEDDLDDNCLIINSLQDLENKIKELKDNETNQRQENINTIKELETFINKLIEPNKDLYRKSSVETKNTDSEYGNVEITLYLTSKEYHKDDYKKNDLYINVEIDNKTGRIKYYCTDKKYYEKEEIDIVKENIVNEVNTFNEYQK